MVCAFDEAIGLHYLILFTKLCLIMGILVKHYITHDSEIPTNQTTETFWCHPLL